MAEAFFHRKKAVFHYFQLAIKILARACSRKPLWGEKWSILQLPYVGSCVVGTISGLGQTYLKNRP